MLNAFSFLKKNRRCCILECTEEECASHSSLSSIMMPRYLYWLTIVTFSPLIEIGNNGSFFTLKSITNSFVFLTLRRRKCSSHQFVNTSIKSKYSLSSSFKIKSKRNTKTRWLRLRIHFLLKSQKLFNVVPMGFCT